mmetsp:Transcript_23389/g.51334  ORF Transcript_23389/g.51334 Transcript_23389/m.51334 type:complete len:405 (-) Transcript_23389:715-1929(-)
MHGLVLALLYSLGIAGLLPSSYASELTTAAENTFKPTIDIKATCPRPRIAIVNGVSFHFEVLSGILYVLQPYERHIDVFLSPYVRSANYDGAWDLVRWSKANFKGTNANLRTSNVTYDLLILISPDYELQLNQHMVKHLNPRLTLAIVHNANYEHMPELLNLTPSLELLTLSPHVAATLSKATNRAANWLLAIYPVKPEPDCTSNLPTEQLMGMCLRGFAMQGKFSNLRRNYTSMWTQLLKHIETISDPQVGKVFHLNVLGKGPDRLALPPELQNCVTVHRRLHYKSFYNVIYHTLGLVPSLANPRYLVEKFSSTIMTSLNTGVPLLASPQLLAAYSFLDKEAVLLQEEGEGEVDAMLRISRLPAEAVMRVRARLQQLRLDLNTRSWGLLEGFLARACGMRQQQ